MTEPRHPKGTSKDPRSIIAWVGMNYDLSPAARNQIMLIAMNDILGVAPTKPPIEVDDEVIA